MPTPFGDGIDPVSIMALLSGGGGGSGGFGGGGFGGRQPQLTPEQSAEQLEGLLQQVQQSNAFNVPAQQIDVPAGPNAAQRAGALLSSLAPLFNPNNVQGLTDRRPLEDIRAQENRNLAAQLQQAQLNQQAAQGTANRQLAAATAAQRASRTGGSNALDRLAFTQMATLFRQEQNFIRAQVTDLARDFPDSDVKVTDPLPVAIEKVRPAATEKYERGVAQQEAIITSSVIRQKEQKRGAQALDQARITHKGLTNSLDVIRQSADVLHAPSLVESATTALDSLGARLAKLVPDEDGFVPVGVVSTLEDDMTRFQSSNITKLNTAIGNAKSLSNGKDQALLRNYFEIRQAGIDLLDLMEKVPGLGGKLEGTQAVLATKSFFNLGQKVPDPNDPREEVLATDAFQTLVARFNKLTAFSEGGKNLTGTELTIIIRSLVAENMNEGTIKFNVRQTVESTLRQLESIARKRKFFLSETTEPDIEILRGISETYALDEDSQPRGVTPQDHMWVVGGDQQ